VGVGNVGDITGGNRAAIDDFKASRVLEGCEGYFVMTGKVFIYKSDSGSSTVNQGVSSNGLIAERKVAKNHKMPSFHYYLRN